MGTYKNKAYTLRLDNELMNKVRAIAEKEDRKISDQLTKIVKEYVRNYEEQNGNINIGSISQDGVGNTINIG